MVEYSENAKKVYEKLYLKRNSLTEEFMENIEQCNRRVASFLAISKEEADEFFEVLQNKSFRPNTPTMVNAGVSKKPNLAACFLLGLTDSMESIIEMWAICAKVYEGGGGVGIPISNLREHESPISDGGHSSGPLSFLKTVQSISDQVKSGGRSRRAANLASFVYNHPDTLDFVRCKFNNDQFNAINISLCVDYEFMSRIDSKEFVDIKSPNPLLKDRKIEKFTYRELWNAIIDAAWTSGDPGLLFMDRINELNPLPSQGRIETTNPCGEVCLPAWSVCDLGHINLNNFVTIQPGHTVELTDDFERCVDIGVRLLNRIIDKTHFPSSKFKEKMYATRPIGLGLMGFADVLYKARIPYDSDKARRVLESITKSLTKMAFRSSIRLAKTEGIKIEITEQDKERFFEIVKSHGLTDDDLNDIRSTGIANCTVTTLAPTGSTAISADASYSFEPMFSLAWKKNILDSDESWFFINPEFKQYCEEYEIELTDEILKKIQKNNGSIRGIDEFNSDAQRIFCVAHDIAWIDRLQMQAAAQKNITLSISSTVNLPSSATKDDVAKIYKTAYELGLKGITVYRDGSKENQPVDFSASESNTDNRGLIRPMIRYGKTIEVATPRGKLYVTGNYVDDSIMEVFISMGHQGHFDNTLLNTIGRLISKSLQMGVPLAKLTDTMRGAGGEVMFVKLHEDGPTLNLTGIVDLIATILDVHFEADSMPSHSIESSNSEGYDRCPQCQKFTLTRIAGCKGGSCINPDCLYSCCY